MVLSSLPVKVWRMRRRIIEKPIVVVIIVIVKEVNQVEIIEELLRLRLIIINTVRRLMMMSVTLHFVLHLKQVEQSATFL